MAYDPEGPFIIDPERAAGGLGDLLIRCAALLERRERVRLAPLGLTPLQLDVLWLISHVRKGRDPRAIDIARALKLHPVVVARHMRLFEARGWLTRSPSGLDGQSKGLHLTEQGLAKLKEVSSAPLGPGPSFFEPLGREHKGFERLLKLLLRAHDPDCESSKSIRERREQRRKAWKAREKLQINL